MTEIVSFIVCLLSSLRAITMVVTRISQNHSYSKEWDAVLPLPAIPVFMSSLIISVVAFAIFANSMNGKFVFDDSEAVINNQDVLIETPVSNIFFNDFWGTPLTHNGSHKSYRPVTILTFRWNFKMAGGMHPFGFRFTNIVLHGGVSALAVPVVNHLLGGKAPRLSFLTALLFAVHPIHTEAIAGVVGRADLLCALFCFLSFLAYVQSTKTVTVSTLRCSFHLAQSLIFCALALFSKEQGITIIGICLAYDLIVIQKFNPSQLPFILMKSSWKPFSVKQMHTQSGKDHGSKFAGKKPLIIRCLALVLAGTLLLYMRWRIMGSKPPTFQHVDNPASFAENIWTRVWSYNYLYSLNVWLLLCPEWLCFDWSMGCVPLLDQPADFRIGTILVFWTALLSFLFRGVVANDNISRTLNMAVAVIVIPFLPASNLFFRVGFVLAERVLYIPSLGFCLLVVLGMQVIITNNQHFKKLVMISFACLILLFCCRSIQRSNEWLEEHTLFKSALTICPLNAKVHYNVAKNAADMGDVMTAVREYETALKLHPTYAQAMNNMANILRDKGDLAEAESLLRKALGIQPDFAAAWMNLGIVQASRKQHKEAEISYSKALSHRSHYPECLYNLGNLYLDLKLYEEALRVFRQAVLQRPSFSLAWNNMVIMLENTGNLKEAKAVAQEALRVLPDDPGLHFNLANTLGKMSLFPEAEHHFKKAIELDYLNAIYHSNMGVLYHRWKKYDLAEQKYEDAIRLDSNLKSAKNNLAMLKKFMENL